MINVDMRRAFDRIRSSAWPGETIYVVNQQGDYLIHPDRSREFGALLGKPNNWKADFPNLASLAGTTQAIADIVPDHAARPDGIALAPALSGRDRMGRRHRNNPVRRDHGAGCEHQEHLASGRRDRGVVSGSAGAIDREVADPADRPADRSRSGGGQQGEGRHSGRCSRRDRRARARVCASDRGSECEDRRA